MSPSQAARDALKTRTRLIADTQAEIRRLLEAAAASILNLLAGQPTDYQRWYLPQLLTQIRSVLDATGSRAAAVAGVAQKSAWEAGAALPDAVAKAARIEAVMPVLDAGQLDAMQHFLTTKIDGITVAAADQINTALGMVVIGAETPFDAMKKVSAIVGDQTGKRATMIVRTELARAYSTANQARMEQMVQTVPWLRKKWVKSGKLHPRHAHAVIHGQIQPVDQPFLLHVQSKTGDLVKITMMYPHDPKAPAKETINCGCVSVPVLSRDNPYGLKSTIKDAAEQENAQARDALKAMQQARDPHDP